MYGIRHPHPSFLFLPYLRNVCIFCKRYDAIQSEKSVADSCALYKEGNPVLGDARPVLDDQSTTQANSVPDTGAKQRGNNGGGTCGMMLEMMGNDDGVRAGAKGEAGPEILDQSSWKKRFFSIPYEVVNKRGCITWLE